MPHSVTVEAIQHHFRLTVWDIVAVAIRQKKYVRRRCHPNPTETNLDTGNVRTLVPKHLSFIEYSIVVRVLKNQDAILHPRIKTQLGVRIGVTLRHPQAAATVPRHRDRLLHLRLRCAELHGESLGNGDPLQHLGSVRKRRGQLLSVKQFLFSGRPKLDRANQRRDQ